MATTKNTKQQPFDRNTIEAFKESGTDIVKGVGNSIKHQLLEELTISSLWDHALKPSPHEKAGDKEKAQHGEEVEIFSSEKKVHIEAAMDYAGEILHADEKIQREENKELRTQIEEIKIELVKISKSSKQLQSAFRDINTAPMPVNPGKYHLNFFEWVLSVLRSASIRVQEASTWMSVVSGKKEKKGYWNSAKKHGTSFTLSSERVVAQQVG